jgi:hypothetical protein
MRTGAHVLSPAAWPHMDAKTRLLECNAPAEVRPHPA